MCTVLSVAYSPLRAAAFGKKRDSLKHFAQSSDQKWQRDQLLALNAPFHVRPHIKNAD